MKKLLLALTLVGAGAIVAGCGAGPCDRLQDICNKCKDSATKQSCDQAVATYKGVPGGDTDCQAVIDAKTYGNCQ